MLIIAIGFEVFLGMEVIAEVGPHYTDGDVIRIMVATSFMYLALGAVWCGLKMSEKEQITKSNLRDKVITVLQSKRKDRINEAIDILYHPNGYPKNV